MRKRTLYRTNNAANDLTLMQVSASKQRMNATSTLNTAKILDYNRYTTTTTTGTPSNYRLHSATMRKS